jgi:hypothetical protein
VADHKNKITLIFIINGQEFASEVNVNAPLMVAVQHVLGSSGNSGRPPEEWEARDSAGVLLEKHQKVEELALKNNARIFLSLSVGAGGNAIRS